MPHDTDPLRAVQAASLHDPGAAPDDDDLVLVECIHAYQINRIEGSAEVTVTYPVGSDTVLSAQPGGGWLLVPRDRQGPYERALRVPADRPDRVVFAPEGKAGKAWILPYTDVIPNV